MVNGNVYRNRERLLMELQGFVYAITSAVNFLYEVQ